MFRLIIITLAYLVTSCLNIPERDVDTLYLKDGSHEYQRSVALYNLYEHYRLSSKSEDFYEIISKKSGRYIINYYPKEELLTLCADPGSGWSGQYKVNEQLFEKLIRYNVTFDDILGNTEKNYDSLLIRNKPTFNVKTNGNP